MLNTQRLTRSVCLLIAFCITRCALSPVQAQNTETQFLSGTGSDNTVNWQFYCTGGNNSGKWTTIPVPSNWELQGFGKYNYGLDKDSVRGKEQGLYKYAFTIPASWKSKTVQIVFEGSMTDTEVKINGKLAGPTHRGSFYCFKYDISSLLKYGKQNLLEVTVSKHSANESVNGAERKGDFWIFGGIFRPVYLQALPKEHIEQVSLTAQANGQFVSLLRLSSIKAADEVAVQLYTMEGAATGDSITSMIKPGDTLVLLNGVVHSPKEWTPESPNRYTAKYTLRQKGNAIHTVTEKIGFRTVELRERDGIYLNGVKIKFKGVCRHSFRPETGRALNEKNSIEDVQLIKDMNMNAVRMSHYPPDGHFLDACDSLGLLVLDELAGWHHAYDTEVGTQLVKEMIAHDVNHPSIVLWDNGNEGGHNFDLDHLFDSADIQGRPLIHPWQRFRGTNTQHYVNYDYGSGVGTHGHDVFFPTEFLHGLYDGGLGAGLEDYWKQWWDHPLSAGGFLWVFADEAVVRTDKNGILDADGNHAPDGILGPHHEKEGSYYAIKEIWSPVYFEPREITADFDGVFRVQNRFHFTDLVKCRFDWKLVKLPSLTGTTDASPLIAPVVVTPTAPLEYGHMYLGLPSNWRDFDVLYITGYDPYGREINTWSWPLKQPAAIATGLVSKGTGIATVSEQGAQFIVKANGSAITFNHATGLLEKVETSMGIIPISNGPLLSEGDTSFHAMTSRQENGNVIIESGIVRNSAFQSLQWTIYPSGWVKMQVKFFPKEYESSLIGINFSFPETGIKSIEWMGNGPYRVWKNRMKGTTLNVWKKDYNNTATGEEEVIYPEFKGYFSNFYWMKLNTTGLPLKVACADEDVFLRLFTPKFSATPFNTAPAFPSGDLSFMLGITPIGTKSQRADRTGPMGQKYMYYDFSKDPSWAKEITLYFDFSGRQ